MPLDKFITSSSRLIIKFTFAEEYSQVIWFFSLLIDFLYCKLYMVTFCSHTFPDASKIFSVFESKESRLPASVSKQIVQLLLLFVVVILILSLVTG